MAKIYRAKNALINQRDELAQALRIAPESLAARFDLTDALLIANDPRSALGILEGAQQAQKQSLRYLLVHNWVLIAAGRGDEARQGVESALAVAKTPEALLQDGLLRLSKQDFKGARDALEQVLNSNPEDLRPLTRWFSPTWPRSRSRTPRGPYSRRLPSVLSLWLYRCTGPGGCAKRPKAGSHAGHRGCCCRRSK
jgi:tetratricopeptide (TPR) repeat protein